MNRYSRHIKIFFFNFLKNDYILFFVGLCRYFYFRLTRPISILETPNSIEISNQHNLKYISDIRMQFFMKRFDKLIFSMMANERFNTDSKILIIGPRSESDILKLNSFGYKNIEAIDLLSYSPRIKVMDACNLLYDTNTFDCIFCGWVLPYIKNPQLIADNIFRVIKNDGMISIGIAYHDDKLINSLDSIKKLFKDKIKNIFFQYDAELKHKSMIDIYKITEQESSSVIISFTVKK